MTEVVAVAASPDTGTGADGAPRRLATDSVTVGGWTLVSRVLGLVRVVVIGAALGSTFFANTFQAGYTVPNLVFTVVAGPVLAMVAVPAVVRAVTDRGIDAARGFVGRFAGVLLAASVVLAVGVVAAAPAVAWSLTVGVPDALVRERAFEHAVLLVVLVAPQVVLYTAAGLAVAVQQARGRFALAAAAPAVENVVVVATVVAVALAFGTGQEADRVSTLTVVLLGLGSTLGVAVHAGVQLVGARRVGLLVGPRRGGIGDPEVRGAAVRIARAVPVAASPAAAMYVLLAAAGTVAGGVFVVQLAVTVFYALSYLGPRAVSMAVLPGLAASAHAGDRAGYAAGWRRGLSFATVAGVLPLVLLAVLAGPTARLLALGDAATPAVLTGLGLCLAVVALAQLPGGWHDIGRQALYARHDDVGPRRAAALAFAGVAVGAVVALAVAPGWPRLVLLAGALLLGEVAAATAVLARLRRALAPERLVDLRATAATLGAGLAVLPVALVGRAALARVGDGHAAALGVLLVVGLVALGMYVLAVRALLPRVAR